MKFDWESWKKCAADLATTAETISGVASNRLPALGDVTAAGATAEVSTLADAAIASIFPASVEAIQEVLNEAAEQLVQESIGAYETGQLYHDIESDNTLASQQITDLLGQTPFN